MTQNIETGVEIVAVGKQFVAKFYYDGKLQHSTHPQYSRQNAIMLINRKKGANREMIKYDKPRKQKRK